VGWSASFRPIPQSIRQKWSDPTQGVGSNTRLVPWWIGELVHLKKVILLTIYYTKNIVVVVKKIVFWTYLTLIYFYFYSLNMIDHLKEVHSKLQSVSPKINRFERIRIHMTRLGEINGKTIKYFIWHFISLFSTKIVCSSTVLFSCSLSKLSVAASNYLDLHISK